jgi:DNA-binding transcriptional regulator YhcF (GntR family)
MMRRNDTHNARRQDITPSTLLVPTQRPVWEVVKQYIEDQITLGTYPVGSWLPSVRQMSIQTGLNRNTISKAYQSLGNDGTVVSKQGVGVLVTRRPNDHRPADDHLATLVRALVQEAGRTGISSQSLIERVEEEVARHSRVQQLRLGFIECSPADTEMMAQHLSGNLEIPVVPIDLFDFLACAESYATRFDLLATTFFHLQEVATAAEPYGIEIVGLNHVPTHESILKLARISSDDVIGLICVNTRTADKVSNVIRMYTRSRIVTSIVDDDTNLSAIVDLADVLIDTVQTHDDVVNCANGRPIITMVFQTEPQSIEYLQSRVAALTPMHISQAH